jgi:putative hydrolase of the HAD superfamily
MKDITDIFFDLDHTLWDFDKNSEISYKIIFNELNLEVPLADFIDVYSIINVKLWKLFREDKIDKQTLRYKRLKDSFLAIGIDYPEAILSKIADLYIYYLSKQTSLLEGAIELLDYLKPKYKLHIITNGFAEIQENKLFNSNLSNYFDVVVNSEMATAKKPSPIIFKMALEMANVSKENSLMIGDSLEADVLGAIDFGIEAICYNYHKEKIPNHIISINNLIELKTLL